MPQSDRKTPPRRTAAQIREEFLDFFAQKQHTIVPSAPLVPEDDPSLLFINAGMNQFKDVFLGTGSRPYLRAADSQKCLRVSGKHNDLEEVGLDTYHHTFFEMLGNWSFGNYFKKEAIAWAWELLTERWGLSKDRLYATVHRGDSTLGLRADEKAATYWRRHLPGERLLYCSTKHNFWMMGDTGPCGPCSEIHVDLRSDEERARVPGRKLVNQDDPRVIELWNLVFIQFNAVSGGVLEPLAARHVDTGMGLERLVAVLQHTPSTYDTDLFVPLMARIVALAEIAGVRGYDDMDVKDTEKRRELRVAMRVVADHIRAIAFAIADGVIPGNLGRPYVIRRILRRAARYGYTALGFREPFLHQLVEPLVQTMGNQYLELVHHQERIRKVIRGEERAFLQTLGKGIEMFETMVPYVSALTHGDADAQRVAKSRLADEPRAKTLLRHSYGTSRGKEKAIRAFVQVASRGKIPGELAFLLHDTYGFPLDLTQLLARERDLNVDKRGYNKLMARQMERARRDLHTKNVALKTDKGRTNWQTVSAGDDSKFLGYDELTVTGLSVRALHRAKPFMVVLDATPFYAEMGGQVGDTGVLRIGGETIEVTDTQVVRGRTCHMVERLPEHIVGAVRAEVAHGRRQRICKHHTATHLLHGALRKVLGPGVAQKGSLVAPGYLRFDFSHYERVKPDVLRHIQIHINELIQRNVQAAIESHVPLQEALRRGATALFGEKYGSHVRVVMFDEDFSVELCGGTHVEATGELGLLLIRSEGSVAAGVRRVEAVTGIDAVDLVQKELAALGDVRRQLKRSPGPVAEQVAALQQSNKALQKEVEQLHNERLAQSLDGLVRAAVRVGARRIAIGRVADVKMGALRKLGEELRRRLGAGSVGVLGAADPGGGKAYLVATVSDDLVAEGNNASTIVGNLARQIDGGGGGRPHLATAGGRSPEKLDAALGHAQHLVGAHLESAG